MKTIWAHTLVRNEEKWVWYSVMSVIGYVDKILLWDMESTDGTAAICEAIKRIYPDKIELRRIKKVDPKGFTQVRQSMLSATYSDWFLVVDGDEIWWDKSIRRITEGIQKKGDGLDSLVVPIYVAVGDIFHYQSESAGRYRLAGRIGHLALRAINRQIPGLSSDKPHGVWGWVDGTGKMVQDRNPKKIAFLEAPYIHTTHLLRAGTRQADKGVIKRAQKLKHEIGKSFPRDFYYPEVFFREKPDFVPSPWSTMSGEFKFRAYIETPLRKIKRTLMKGGVGY